MKIGAHVSIAGGVHTAFDRAIKLGSETIQIFASSPRAWKFREFKPEDVLKYREASEETGIAPVFIHGSYLVNIGGSARPVGKVCQLPCAEHERGSRPSTPLASSSTRAVTRARDSTPCSERHRIRSGGCWTPAPKAPGLSSKTAPVWERTSGPRSRSWAR